MNKEFTVCYRSVVDQAWVPFEHYPRRDLRGAVRAVRQLGQAFTLRTQWCLKRGKKVICRIPARSAS